MINEDDVIKTEKDGIYTLSVKLSDNSGYIDIFSSNIRTFVYVANYYLRNTITTRNVENMDSYIMIVLKIIDSMLQKMIKGIYYHSVSYTHLKVFSNTDIKGGIAITYFDSLSENKPIEVFSAYSELNSILTKVKAHNYDSFSELIFAPESYKFVSLLYDEHPEIKTMVIKNRRGEDVPLISKGHDYDLTTNIFDKLYNIIFFMDKPTSDEDYIQVIGRMNNERVNMWVKRKYINNHQNLNKWKVIVPKSNGTGAIGEVLSLSLIHI